MFEIRDYDPIPKMNWEINLGPVSVGSGGVKVNDPKQATLDIGQNIPKTNLSSQWSEWDNPFTNVAKEISGSNGGFFNPFDGPMKSDFANNLGLGKQNDQLRQGWNGVKIWSQEALHSNAKNLAGEVTGGNRQRQQQWEEKVKQDAKAAQDLFMGQQLDAKQKLDLAGSGAAGFARRTPGSRLGKNLNFNIGNADITDYLGL